MKPYEQKVKFIELRAKGLSYRKIADELCISKSTCQAWAKELEAEIAARKQEDLEALYDSYGMSKEARIKALGDTIKRINKALEFAALVDVEADKLLRLKLQYMQEQAKLYTPAQPENFLKGTDIEDITQAYKSLYNRVVAGEISDEQANRERAILDSMMRAYDYTALAEKVTNLEKALRGY